MNSPWILMPRSDSAFSRQTFAMPLLEWHLHHGRTLPWMTKHPYDVWLSEVMLQQTQVSTVLERYASFQQCFPTIRSLSAASVEDVLAQWSGLGYYRRARNLHACAKALVQWLDDQGDWPRQASEWLALPGIGQSTANAIVSACFDKVEPILDANAKRVLLRFAGDAQANDKKAWAYAAEAMDVSSDQAASYTQAMMDLGATVCTARKADCIRCPLATDCRSVGWTAPLKTAARKADSGDTAPEKSGKPVVVFHWALCSRNDGSEVLLAQRDEASFWPGLWVLPAWDDRFVPIQEAKALSLRHELSHRSLRIQANKATLVESHAANERWVQVSDILERKIPVPTPVAGFIKAL